MLGFILSYWKLFLTLFILQGCLGIALVELSFKVMKRAIEVVEERDSQFPSFRRLDVQHWKRGVFYPGAFFYMVPRFASTLGTFFSYGIWMYICYIGSGIPHNKPLSGFRRTVFEFVCKYHCLMICLLYGYKVTHKFKHERQVDWSKYLGPDWRENKQ